MTERLAVSALVGPTAVGKTDVSLEVSEELGAEVVSLDSMQVYVGMDIGTAKPDRSMWKRVPHHLIDLFPPSHDVTVAEFQTLAREAISDIASRGRVPLLVGGSGLYFRAVVDDLRFPPRDDAVRGELEEELEQLGARALYERLASLDPEAAERIEPANARRTIRALEVIRLTGRPFSENKTWDSYESRYDLVVAGLTRDRFELHARIAERVQRMLADGLVQEAAMVSQEGLGRTAAQALGYKQILESSAGEPAKDLADRIVAATNRFARRQESWFKSDPRVEWFDASAPDLARRLIEFFRPSAAG